jgi:hypothetical protein
MTLSNNVLHGRDRVVVTRTLGPFIACWVGTCDQLCDPHSLSRQGDLA